MLTKSNKSIAALSVNNTIGSSNHGQRGQKTELQLAYPMVMTTVAWVKPCESKKRMINVFIEHDIKILLSKLN
jgi:hypothetical protein